MTATTDLTEIRCDGPGTRDRYTCPSRKSRYSNQHTSSELRDSLTRVGWESIWNGDLIIDRCPNCGNGTA